jgi:hypothetical protein
VLTKKSNNLAQRNPMNTSVQRHDVYTNVRVRYPGQDPDFFDDVVRLLGKFATERRILDCYGDRVTSIVEDPLCTRDG